VFSEKCEAGADDPRYFAKPFPVRMQWEGTRAALITSFRTRIEKLLSPQIMATSFLVPNFSFIKFTPCCYCDVGGFTARQLGAGLPVKRSSPESGMMYIRSFPFDGPHFQPFFPTSQAIAYGDLPSFV